MTKMGAPSTTAASRATSPGTTSRAGDSGGQSPIHKMLSASSNATSRPRRVSAACHSNRNAMTPKPSGMMS